MSSPYDLLNGIRIIELANWVFAPTAGRLLSDWGAEIVKIETPPTGDFTRTFVPLAGLTGEMTFETHNANKKSIVINLKTPEGQRILYDLLGTADVLLTNIRPKPLKKLGFDYESVAARFPQIIYASVSGFGELGPKADDPGFDSVAFWALGGVMTAGMEKDTSPIIPPAAFGDMSSACTLAGAICAALLKKERTGQGSKLHLSLLAQAIWNMCESVMAIQTGQDYYPKSRTKANPMNNTYKCKDGKWIMVTCYEYDRYFPLLMRVFKHEELIGDPRFDSFANALKNSSVLISLLDEAFAAYTRAEAIELLTKNDIAHAMVSDVSDLLELQQTRANQLIKQVTLPSGLQHYQVVSPVKYGDELLPPYKPAPGLGEQTTELLQEIGYSEEQIRAYLDAGITQ